MSPDKSYGQILKSSSIMGGAAGITMLLGMVRTKFAAVFVGSIGLGQVAGFLAIQGLLGTVSGFGIQSSAVREIAVAVSRGDSNKIGRTVLTLRRISWITGLLGMLFMVVLSPLLTRLTFDTDVYTVDIAALGVTLLLANLNGSQLAIMQGTRQITDMARANIGGACFATFSASSFYYWLGLRGIVPALISISFFQLAITWYFARRVTVPVVHMSWKETFLEAGKMTRLGLVFMWSGLMLSGVGFFTITIITREIGLHAVGLYSAAFSLSGVFVNFVLGAMGADYYPRLTGISYDLAAINRLVNEQIEIGLLLALPGLLATLIMAQWLLQLFYTNEFFGAVELIQWFVLGCLGRVISWPMGYVILGLGKDRWYFLSEAAFHLAHMALIYIGIKWFGIEGVGIAFFLVYLGYIAAVYYACKILTNFSWTIGCIRLVMHTAPLFVLMFLMTRSFQGWLALMIGVLVILILVIYCLRGIVRRLGSENSVVRRISNMRFMKSLIFKKEGRTVK